MASIKAIEGRSIHQIQSGQVIVDLTSVVKELVENSLDAGAKKIDVRFKNHGLDTIEVQDDGNGIAPEDFSSVALKHHTSKLTSFEDLDNLDTFGFRGEAISSMCALASVHIITARAQDSALGKRLDFETSGKLKTTTAVAATKGTLVVVENIFNALPVRRKELEKHHQREWQKVLKMMYEYACISVGIRMSLSNQPSKGKKTVSFQTKGNTTLKENIANCFQAKTLAFLLNLDLRLELSSNGKQPTSSRSIQVEGYISRPGYGEGRQTPDRQMYFVNSRPCQLPQVSKVINEVYKSFNHHQSPFVLANFLMDTKAYDVNVSPDKRSIILDDQTALLDSLRTALSDLFQNSDHVLPQSQLPAVKLPPYRAPTVSKSISLPSPDGSITDESDVSSREQMHNDKAIKVPTNLIEGWAGRGSTQRREKGQGKAARQAQQQRVMQGPDFVETEAAESEDDNLLLENIEQPAASNSEPSLDIGQTTAGDMLAQRNAFNTLYDTVFLHPPSKSSAQPSSTLTSSQRASESASRLTQRQTPRLIQQDEQPIPSIFNSAPRVSSGPINDAFARMRPRQMSSGSAEVTIGDHSVVTTIGEGWPSKKRRIHTHKPLDLSSSSPSSSAFAAFAAPGSQLALTAPTQAYSEHSDSDADSTGADGTPVLTAKRPTQSDSAAFDLGLLEESTAVEQLDSTSIEESEADKKDREDRLVAQLIHDAENPSPKKSTQRGMAIEASSRRKDYTYDLERTVKTSLKQIRAGQHYVGSMPEPPSAVDDETEDIDAESKLSLTVSKSDFEQMRIVGQFNLGFILAVRPGADGAQDELFIIDQHAADEKANYERLQSTVVLQSQPLVQPKLLELTAIEEEVVSAHPEALQANGFDIETTENDDDSRSYRLLTLPTSHNTTFKLTDLEELLHLLSELSVDSSEIPRPRKVQKMLAMRACRSSIMVGKTLSMKQMTKVVRHMGGMEKPWNCPHGRPTMRHLTQLSSWQGWQESQSLEDEGENHDKDGSTDWEAWLQSIT